MQLRWEKNNHSNTINVQNNPIIKGILEQKRLGQGRSQIIEDLIKKGYSLKNIKSAYQTIAGKKNKILDWRSPTAINETSRHIRNDIRRNKISYTLGMKILIRARNTLMTMIKNPGGNDRIRQFNQEIMITKKLNKLYANPLMVRSYHIY